ncbi:TIGR00725 family protein [Thermogymnomonas acidicola]|uniref:TIGR00725 family protein n=1 Tax=Thermogymnomonas acidicola TaxID=399579 RepID=UPI00094645FF|nr:TIGR00725 family protein [Thermogymnomonas acidicola]
MEIAEEIGRLLARRGGCRVFCGGLTGVMEYVAKGVSEEGGIVVGFLPGMSAVNGNHYLTVPVPTGMGYLRNFLIVRASEAVIAIDGSTGTLSEAAFTVSEGGKSLVHIGPIPVRKSKENEGEVLEARTPEEAVDLAISEASKQRERDLKKDQFWSGTFW